MCRFSFAVDVTGVDLPAGKVCTVMKDFFSILIKLVMKIV